MVVPVDLDLPVKSRRDGDLCHPRRVFRRDKSKQSERSFPRRGRGRPGLGAKSSAMMVRYRDTIDEKWSLTMRMTPELRGSGSGCCSRLHGEPELWTLQLWHCSLFARNLFLGKKTRFCERWRTIWTSGLRMTVTNSSGKNEVNELMKSISV
jgi:hypothetical protein